MSDNKEPDAYVFYRDKYELNPVFAYHVPCLNERVFFRGTSGPYIIREAYPRWPPAGGAHCEGHVYASWSVAWEGGGVREDMDESYLDERFNFCPRCGCDLRPAWAEHDQKRETEESK